MGEISRRGWRYFIPIIICLSHWIENSRSIPIGNLKKSTNTSQSASKVLGSESELTWQAWFLLGPENTNLDSSSNILRKITPKSVFIAPDFQDCAEGYRADSMGRCVKNVPINREAQLDFFLQNLNALYGRGPESNSNADKIVSTPARRPESTGPMQFNIPFTTNVKPSNADNFQLDNDEEIEEQVEKKKEEEEAIESVIFPIAISPEEEKDSSKRKISTNTSFMGNETNATDVPPILIIFTSNETTNEEDQEYITTTTITSTLLEDITETPVTETNPIRSSVYEDDEYGDNVDETSEDDSEILKHGEAGMTIPRDNIDKLFGTRIKDKVSTTSEDIDNGSGESMYQDKDSFDDLTSTTSNDMIIDDSETSTTIDEVGSGDVSTDDNFNEESNETTTTTTTTTTTNAEETTAYLIKSTTTKDQLITDQTSSELLLYEVHSKRNPSNDEIFGNKKIEKLKTVTDGFVKFPEQKKQENYVRFPSEDFNSIHMQKHKKERFSYRSRFDNRDETNGGSSHRKQVYWWITPTWGIDSQSPRTRERVPTSTPISIQRQKNRPQYLSFWTNMPLVKDPSLYPDSVRNEGLRGETNDRNGSSQRRKSFRSRRIHSKNQRTILAHE